MSTGKEDQITNDKRYLEWQQAQEHLMTFDKMIMELRKYGFGFVTILLTANGIIIGKDAVVVNDLVVVGISLALFVLIVGLFRIDRYHETFLRSGVLRAMRLEQQLDLGLTSTITYWSEELKTATWGALLYALFCFAVFGITLAHLLDKINVNLLAVGLSFIFFISALVIIANYGYKTKKKIKREFELYHDKIESYYWEPLCVSREDIECSGSQHNHRHERRSEKQSLRGGSKSMLQKKIYLAGPLFTQAELMWNKQLGDLIKSEGKEQYLDLEIILPQETTRLAVQQKDFERVKEICLEGIENSDIVVANLDGADSDSGTCFECGYARAKDKIVIGVRTDVRGGEDQGLNAMLSRSCEQPIIQHESIDGTTEELKGLAYKIVRRLAIKWLKAETTMVDVTLHIDENMTPCERDELRAGLFKLEGVMAADFSKDNPHLLIIEYDPDEVESSEFLDVTKAMGFHAEQIGL